MKNIEYVTLLLATILVFLLIISITLHDLLKSKCSISKEEIEYFIVYFTISLFLFILLLMTFQLVIISPEIRCLK